MRQLRVTPTLLARLAFFNAGVRRAREAYRNRDVAMFEDCPEEKCGPEATCSHCRRRARDLLTVATSEDECAELLAILDRPGLFIRQGCGTEAGYVRHRRYKQRACQECLAAHAEYHRQRRAPL